MGPLAEEIVLPRRTTPRVRVASGSVAIARGQTGIYPSESPGGWHLIGRTPLRMFDIGRSEPFLFKAGDRVQFHRIAEAAYREGQECRPSA
jgi:inhibitor of KinA